MEFVRLWCLVCLAAFCPAASGLCSKKLTQKVYMNEDGLQKLKDQMNQLSNTVNQLNNTVNQQNTEMTTLKEQIESCACSSGENGTKVDVREANQLRKALQCFNGRWLSLDCDAKWGGQIAIEKVIYGNDENKTISQQECPSHPWNKVCVNSQSTINRITKKMKYRCDGRAGCYQLVHQGWWGDTCHGASKYMKIYYRCVDALPEAQAGPSHTISVCLGGHHKRDIACDPKEGTRIHIQKVWLGSPPDRALAKAQCPSFTWRSDCVPREHMLSNHFQHTRITCEGKSQCTVNHDLVIRGGDPCHGAKMLTIIYNCY